MWLSGGPTCAAGPGEGHGGVLPLLEEQHVPILRRVTREAQRGVRGQLRVRAGAAAGRGARRGRLRPRRSPVWLTLLKECRADADPPLSSAAGRSSSRRPKRPGAACVQRWDISSSGRDRACKSGGNLRASRCRSKQALVRCSAAAAAGSAAAAGRGLAWGAGALVGGLVDGAGAPARQGVTKRRVVAQPPHAHSLNNGGPTTAVPILTSAARCSAGAAPLYMR